MFKLDIISETLAVGNIECSDIGIEFTMPICRLGDSDSCIIGFDSMGSTTLIHVVALALIEKMGLRYNNISSIVCPEAKAIPVAQEMARLLGIDYFVLRKSQKAYMKMPASIEVQSITTKGKQLLWYDKVEAMKKLEGKVLLFDDVVSTGSSFRALEEFAKQNNLHVGGKCAVLSEGMSKNRDDVVTLGYLPILSYSWLKDHFKK